jgi:DNA-binding MarR family transcriptional regulator
MGWQQRYRPTVWHDPNAFALRHDNQSLRITMKRPTRPADIYLRFLQLADAIRGLPALPLLDPLEERILALVARAGQEQKRLSVRDMMAKEEIGSPATVHNRLKSMRQKGWIMLSDTEDSRRKQIELTQAALQHFDSLSKCLVEAAKGN